jgi:hypothetical protein
MSRVPSLSLVMTTPTGVINVVDRRPGAVFSELQASFLRVPAISVSSSSNRPVDDALLVRPTFSLSCLLEAEIHLQNAVDTRFTYKVTFEVSVMLN